MIKKISKIKTLTPDRIIGFIYKFIYRPGKNISAWQVSFMIFMLVAILRLSQLDTPPRPQGRDELLNNIIIYTMAAYFIVVGCLLIRIIYTIDDDINKGDYKTARLTKDLIILGVAAFSSLASSNAFRTIKLREEETINFLHPLYITLTATYIVIFYTIVRSYESFLGKEKACEIRDRFSKYAILIGITIITVSAGYESTQLARFSQTPEVVLTYSRTFLPLTISFLMIGTLGLIIRVVVNWMPESIRINNWHHGSRPVNMNKKIIRKKVRNFEVQKI